MANKVITVKHSDSIESNSAGYLYINADVLKSRMPAEVHKQLHGINEGRREFVESSVFEIGAIRKAKALRLDRLIDSSKAESYKSNFFQHEHVKWINRLGKLPIQQNEIGVNSYDEDLSEYLDEHSNEIWLDVGAGLRDIYRENVVYSDISDLPTTDVICFGEDLPFKDDSFDGVVCLAVLEHVENPKKVLDEMIRVVKPSGRVIIDWPFLQPYHGHPFHFYNATKEGMRSLAAQNVKAKVVDISTPDWFHPIHSIQWILRNWTSSLSVEDRASFESITIKEILEINPYEFISGNPAAKINLATKSGIGAGHRMIIEKKN